MEHHNLEYVNAMYITYKCAVFIHFPLHFFRRAPPSSNGKAHHWEPLLLHLNCWSKMVEKNNGTYYSHTPIRSPFLYGEIYGNRGPIIGLIGSLDKFIGIFSLHGLCITWNSHGHHRQPLPSPPENDLLLVLVIFHLWKKHTKWNITKSNKWKRIIFLYKTCPKPSVFLQRNIFSTNWQWPRFTLW